MHSPPPNWLLSPSTQSGLRSSVHTLTAPMKVYDKSTLEKIAIEKHGSLEVITTKHEDKSQAINTKLLNKEKKTKELWNSDELFEPLKEFMSDISLPAEKQGVGKAGAETKQKYTGMVLWYCLIYVVNFVLDIVIKK